MTEHLEAMANSFLADLQNKEKTRGAINIGAYDEQQIGEVIDALRSAGHPIVVGARYEESTGGVTQWVTLGPAESKFAKATA